MRSGSVSAMLMLALCGCSRTGEGPSPQRSAEVEPVRLENAEIRVLEEHYGVCFSAPKDLRWDLTFSDDTASGLLHTSALPPVRLYRDHYPDRSQFTRKLKSRVEQLTLYRIDLGKGKFGYEAELPKDSYRQLHYFFIAETPDAEAAALTYAQSVTFCALK